jgi:hypothetical protein
VRARGKRSARGRSEDAGERAASQQEQGTLLKALCVALAQVQPILDYLAYDDTNAEQCAWLIEAREFVWRAINLIHRVIDQQSDATIAPAAQPDAPPPKKPPKHGHDGQYGCRVPMNGTKRCPECWKIKAYPGAFDGKHNCNVCRAGARVGGRGLW